MLIHDNSQFSDGFKARLRTAIDKNRPNAEEVANQRGIDFLSGHRVQDTDRVCYLACGELVNKFGSEAPDYADRLDDQAVESLAIEALVESGSCDHWYTYEKDWGVSVMEVLDED